MRVQVLGPILIGWNFSGIREQQAFIEPYFGIDGMRRRYPVDGGFYLPLRLRAAALRVGVLGAPQFCDVACRGVLDQTDAFDDVGIT